MAVLRGEASHFLFHIFQSELIKEQIRERMGATINQITNRDMAEFEIVWPYDERERTRIGMALTDADALIESLEQLLTKKRQIKQGAMQDLLTGQRRLPGFSRASEHHQTELGFIPSDWDVIPIAQIAQCLIGLTYSPNDVRSAGTMVLRSSNVQDGFLAFDDNVYVDMDLPPRVITQEGDILICVRNGSRQLIGKCALIDANTAGSAFGAFMAVLRSTSSAFLFQQFQSAILKKQIGEVMGATINQITNKDMAAFKVIWPKTEDERTAIATVLSDMDTEITAFEAQLSKARHLKQGMAQALLTGRIRLV
jgi:type I restriction enzyme S subunit